MAGYENITIVGNVGRDPELQYTKSGVAVCNFSIAVNLDYKDADGNKVENVKWRRITAWRNLAELCNQYVKKGMQVMVVSSDVEARAYTNNQGEPASSLEVTAQRVIFLGKSGSAGGPPPPTDDDEPAWSQSRTDNPPPPNDMKDIPF